jgi:hypothetical protein
MQVQVQQVVPDGTVAIGRGLDLATGDLVIFSGERRPMRNIQADLEEHAEVVTEISDRAVLSRVDVHGLLDA